MHLKLLYSIPLLLALGWSGRLSAAGPVDYATGGFRLTLSGEGKVESFVDLRDGADKVDSDADRDFCLLRLRKEDAGVAPERMTRRGNTLTFSFPGTRVKVTLRVEEHPEWLTVDVVEIRGGDFYSLRFARIPLAIDYSSDDFAACAMARRINTRALDFPGRSNLLGGECFGGLDHEGAGVFLLGCPEPLLRATMKNVVESYPPGGMPVSRAGGPYAMDEPKNRGSYIINSEPVTLDKVDEWAARLNSFGIDQIDFHQGWPFRQGDFQFNERAYPGGVADFRKVSEAFARHGIITGLHTYSELLSPRSEYVTPVPSKDLDVVAAFTLAEDMTAGAQSIRVEESTAEVKDVTGFLMFRSSRIVRIDDELIVFGETSRSAPWGFNECRRGAYGTKISPHARGARVEQLNQVFNLFAPRAGSELFFEIARRTARTYNEGGFGMIYLDALDGTLGIVEDTEHRWYYEALFVNEVLKHTETPPLMEYSSFTPSLWYARSRMGALDAPRRGYDRFFDRHVAYNHSLADRLYLPSQMGWLFLVPSSGDDNFQYQIFFRENAEYLGAKILAHDSGLSWLDADNPSAHRTGEILKRYDSLRRARYFSAGALDRLRDPGARFMLDGSNGEWFLREANFERVVLRGGESDFSYRNPWHGQAPTIRIESRHMPAEYDSPQGVELVPMDETQPPENLTVREFDTPVDLSQRRGLGLWVCGDGGGQRINIRVESPRHLLSGFTDHIVEVDFTGWRYFALAEADNGLFGEWPFNGEGQLLEEFREPVHYGSVSKVEVQIEGDASGLRLRTVRALPLTETVLMDPALECGGAKITFRGEIPAGQYMEYTPGGRAVVYNAEGAETGEMEPRCAQPFEVAEGGNSLKFSCAGPPEASVCITLRTNDDKKIK